MSGGLDAGIHRACPLKQCLKGQTVLRRDSVERQAESDPLCRVMGVRGLGEMLGSPALPKFAFHRAQVMLNQNRAVIFKFGKYDMIHSMGILGDSQCNWVMKASLKSCRLKSKTKPSL